MSSPAFQAVITTPMRCDRCESKTAPVLVCFRSGEYELFKMCRDCRKLYNATMYHKATKQQKEAIEVVVARQQQNEENNEDARLPRELLA